MLKIRLQRIGKRGQAYFRLVVTEHTSRPQGHYLELLGSYDPHTKTLTTHQDRVSHWLDKGAQMSPTVNNLLVTKGLLDAAKYPKIKNWAPKATKAASA